MMRERLFLIFSAKSLTLVKGDERVEGAEERADAGLLCEGGKTNCRIANSGLGYGDDLDSLHKWQKLSMEGI